MKTRHKVIPAVYLIAMKDNRVLLGLRQNTAYCDGWLGLPSGHVELGESPIQAMIREAKEEIGMVLKPENLTFATVMARKNQDRECVDYFFVCDASSRTITNCEPEKCSSWEFYDIENLPNKIIPYLQRALRAVQKKQVYVEDGWGADCGDVFPG